VEVIGGVPNRGEAAIKELVMLIQCIGIRVEIIGIDLHFHIGCR
jgi:hypothetical protein